MLVVGGWINWKYSQLSPMLVVGGWINWKYNQLSPRLVVGGWINWKYNQISPMMVAELIGNITNSAHGCWLVAGFIATLGPSLPF